MAAPDTLFLGNLDERVDRRMLYEIGCQAGTVVHVSSSSKGFGFVQYASPESCAYALELFSDRLTLFGRNVRVSFSHSGGRG